MEWLGDVPEHWNVSPIKTAIALMESGVSVNSTGTPAEGDQFGVLKTSCVYTGQFDANENKAVAPNEYHRVACPVVADTLIVSCMNTPKLVGAAGLTKQSHVNLFLPGRLWQVYPKNARADFMYYWTRTASYRAQVEMACAGTSPSMQTLGRDDFRAFAFPRPPMAEQATIAAFLDCESTRIDSLITKKTRFIELLREKRQALITRAVTKGLDPTLKMKDSGVEWIGEVPTGWGIRQLKDSFRIVGGATPKSDHEAFWGGEIVWVTPSDMSKLQTLYIEDSQRKITTEGLASCGTTLVPENSIILSTRAPIGSVAITKIECCTNQGCKALVSNDTIGGKFLAYIMTVSSAELIIRGKGTTFMELSRDELGAFKIPYPPAQEQSAIAAFLDHETARIDALVQKTERSIDLLREKRSALITAAVTGAIDTTEMP